LRWIIRIEWYLRDTIHYVAKVVFDRPDSSDSLVSVGRGCYVDPEDMFRQIKTETKALGGGSSS
jgi:hypothetical protein